MLDNLSSRLGGRTSTTNSSSNNTSHFDSLNSSFQGVLNRRENIKQLLREGPSFEVYEALCKAFRNNTFTLNSPLYKINQVEFVKVLNSVAHYRTRLVNVKWTEWHLECGESSSSSSPGATKWQLACHLLSKNHAVLGKLVISHLDKKLIVPKVIMDRNPNLILLGTMEKLTSATIKDQYRAPINHVRLDDIKMTDSRLQLFGVVTGVNKIPTRTRQYWHSLLCLSDPSLAGGDAAPKEFKMHLFMPLLEDFPEVHRGDVVRFTNVKIESHLERCDGRIFHREEMKVYCHWNHHLPVLLENFEDRSTVVRLLSKWWTLNHRFFDIITPWPIYHAHSRYPGVRCFREMSDQLVCDTYCQVTNISDASSDLNFLNVRDGTIFTLEVRQDPPIADEPVEFPLIEAAELPKKTTYGYMALVVFDSGNWTKIKNLRINVGDYLFLKEAKVVFVAQDLFEGMNYPYRCPCILLRPSSNDGFKKVPTDHHEAIKIRSRLHRLPEALEEMINWRFPPLHAEEQPDDPLFTRLCDPEVQSNLLKRLKRF